MNEQQLRCFVQVAQTLSFARAAEALYRTQPTVSHQINSLEEELKVPLFVRNKRIVELTAAGQTFYYEAVKILQEMEDAVDLVTGRNNNFEYSFTVGFACVSETINCSYNDLVQKYRSKHPEAIPALTITGHKTMVVDFKALRLDMMFIKEYELRGMSDYQFIKLFDDGAICVCPESHELAGQKEVLLDEIANYPLILCDPLVLSTSLYEMQDALQMKAKSGKIYYAKLDLEAHSLVKAGYGVALMRRMIAPPPGSGLTSIPIKGRTDYAFGIAWHSGETNPMIRDFIKVVKNELK